MSDMAPKTMGVSLKLGQQRKKFRTPRTLVVCTAVVHWYHEVSEDSLECRNSFGFGIASEDGEGVPRIKSGD